MVTEPQETKGVWKELGGISTKLEALNDSIKDYKDNANKNNNRITLALIGLVAAQIGVKVLGTPVLLDIATAIGIIAIFILFGAIFQGFKVIRQKCHLTRTGWSLVVMMGVIAIVQALVYFRDLGVLGPNVIYAVRIVQNVAILGFAWQFMSNHLITRDKADKPTECDTECKD